jgi:hypothetical protein
MMARITLALLLLGALDRAADACAMKDNEIAIVLGVVNGEVVSVRFALHEDDGATGTEWTGKATLRAGGVEHAIGTLDPKLNAGNEVDRLIAAARTEAGKLAGFVPAVRVSAKDCSDKPGAKCDGVVLENAGTVLRAGTVRSQLALASEPDARNIVAVTRYTALHRRQDHDRRRQHRQRRSQVRGRSARVRWRLPLDHHAPPRRPDRRRARHESVITWLPLRLGWRTEDCRMASR